MALNKQIHIYSVDTGDFYTEKEKQLHRTMIRYGKHKNILKNIKIENYDDSKKNKYNSICKKVNEKIKYYKEILKDEFNSNVDAIRELDKNNLSDKKVISVFESTLTRVANMKIDELTEDIMVIETFFYEVIEQLINNGYAYDGEKYKYFTSSAGQIRLKKAVFIKESVWRKYDKTLMCGLTIDKINQIGGINVNKFLAYLALSNSATDLWEDFDIDRCIVVKDFETKVNGKVDYIDDVTYEITRCVMDVPVSHTDGCGMILPKLSKKNFMTRLPWVKGLLASFDFLKFIKENNCSPIIKDIYGKEWNVINDNIQIIFTESQFKMYKYYSNWDEYKSYFKKYNCQASICNMEDDDFKKATINYQMVQTITDITNEEKQEILSCSQSRLYNISRDKNTMLNAFGATKINKNKSHYQQALELYPELLMDEHSKDILRQIKKSMVKKYRSAKLDVYGKYTFLIPDLYAFCEYLFLGISTPRGLLQNNEVFCRLFKNSKELDCLRSPHLYAEHAVRNNVVDSENLRWFKTDAIYTSCHDLISKILQFDVDGDKSLVVADEKFIEIAKRNINNYDVVPLYYEMKKAKPIILDDKSIWSGLNAAFSGGNIGIYSNNISKIWNSQVFIDGSDEEKQNALNLIKILCMENNFVIDYAKTLYKPKRPPHINTAINSYINYKLPHFFIYAKDKTKTQVEENNDSLVNSLESQFKDKPLRFNIKNFGKLDYKNLMRNKEIDLSNEVIDTYNILNKKYHFRIEQKNQSNVEYIVKLIRDELLVLGYIESDLSDILVKYLYTKKTAHKEVLWKCFGENIVNNLKSNINPNSIQCEKCGKRFVQEHHNQKLCNKCSDYQPIGTKIIKCVDCGKEFEIDSRNMTKDRCDECQHERDKERKREWKRKNRDRYIKK
ncbi:MAG: hypothetical protein LBE23_05820 [Vagococcus sp.]|jgi:hypothetical protein|nr:hypothetical protein [Vagococcus sp.]